jgi:hypothetical protein
VFCRSVLKVSKVLRTSSVIVWVKFMRSFPYLLATAKTERRALKKELEEEMAEARRRKLACFQKTRTG